MAHPFSARPMHFVVASDEQEWWGGCAWDSFGIMAALGQEVLVATTCLRCGRPLALWPTPRPRRPSRTLPTSSCRPPAGGTSGQYLLDHPPGLPPRARRGLAAAGGERVGAVVDLPTMWRLGKVWYGDRLHDDHRRRTPDEATAVFAELGLTGPFWDMGAPPAAP